MTHIYRLALMLIVLTGINSTTSAQCEPVLRSDSTQWLYNGAVLSSTNVGNTIYVGGNFTTMSKSTGGLVNIDAITANPLNLGSWPKVNGNVNAIIPDGLGGYIIAGSFTQVGTSARNRIAQITATGTVTAWNPNADNAINALARSGSTIYVGGGFTTIGGQSRNRIAAIDLASGLATAWDPNSDGVVYALTLNGTTLYVGGTYTSIGGQSRNRIAALSISTGLATSWNPDANSTVLSIMINGSLAYVGGTFTTIGGQSRSNAAAINTSTGLATTWNPAPNSMVYDFAVNGSNILVAGLFSSIGSQPRNGIAEVDANLGNATALNYQLPSAQVYKIKMLGNDLYLGGIFTLSTGQANLIKINRALGTILPWECNLAGGRVAAIEATTTRVLAGGAFTNYYKNRQRIAAIDCITDSLIAWKPNVNGTVNAIAANNSTVYIGGSFSQVSGTTRNSLASLDAATGAVNTWNPAPSSIVNTLRLNGNTLYVGGNFTTISATGRGRAAAYDITTNTLTNWNPQFNNNVLTILTGSTEVYFGGNFTLSGSATRNRIASFNISTGLLTGWNPNADGTVTTLAAQGTSIYVGGSFNNIGGQFRPRLAELIQATGVATTWQPYPNGTVNSIAIDGGIVYTGGNYTNNGGIVRTNLSSVPTSTANATTWDPIPNGQVNHIGIYNGRMIVGGAFSTISGFSYPSGVQYNLMQTAPVVNIMGRSVTCASTPVTFTAYTDVVNASYQWKRNGLNVGTNSATYTVVPANNDQIQVMVTAPVGSCYTPSTGTSNTITVSVTGSVTPTVSVTGNTTVCSGTPTTYTATTNVTNGYFVWRVNGNVTGTNGSTFTYTPANGDQVNVQVFTPLNGCYTSASATSSSLFIVVNTPVAPTMAIATASTTVCAGASVLFTSTTNVTGGTYQWKINGTNVTGATSSTFSTTTLATSNVVTAVVTIPSGGCFTAPDATSNGLTMTVNPNVTPTLTISGNTSPCTSTLTTYTATTNVTGATYQWKRNNVNIGGNSPTLAYFPSGGDVLTCTVTTPAGSCYTVPTITSNSLTINPQSIVTPSATVSGATTVCQGSSATYSVTTNVVGGSYQWKVNGINVGSNNPSFSYNPANSDVVSVVVTTPVGQGCYSTGSATSNNLAITVNAPAVPTITIATLPPGNTTVCSGTPVDYEVTATNITGGTYQWKVNGSNIPGATSNTLSYTPSNGNIITCVVTIPSGACFSPSTGTSNGITMTVTPSITPFISIAAGANNVCAGTTVNYNAATNITGGTYQWKVNAANVGTNSPTFSYAPVNGDIVSCMITVPGTGCFSVPTATSNNVIMQVQSPAIPTVSVTPSATTVCQGATVNYTATTNVTGAFYQWKVNSTTMGTNAPTFSYQPINNDIVMCIITTPSGCYTSNLASSTIIVMKVTAPVSHPFIIGAPGIAEVGSTVTVSADVQANIGAYSIEWRNRGVAFATTTTNTTTYTKTQGIDTITAVITPDNSCFEITASVPVYVHSVATGINELGDKGKISVYPNPFSDRVKIAGLEQGDRVMLFDVTGKELNSWNINKDQSEHIFFIGDLPGGSYMLRVTDKDNTYKINKTLQKL